MSTMFEKVKSFHQDFTCAIADKPTQPDEKLRTLRGRVLIEEFAELIVELFPAHHDGEKGEYQRELMENIFFVIELRNNPNRGIDLPKLAKETCDLHYVLSGTSVSFGIPEDACFDEVHRSNMDKKKPDGSIRRDAYGKVLKPEGYVPADMESILFPKEG